MAEAAGVFEDGVFRKGDVRLSDRAGNKILPIGNDRFASVAETSVFIDKTMLIADVLDKGPAVTLFCRPRRFGKSLNLSMLQRFFEIPVGVDELRRLVRGAGHMGRPRWTLPDPSGRLSGCAVHAQQLEERELS